MREAVGSNTTSWKYGLLTLPGPTYGNGTILGAGFGSDGHTGFREYHYYHCPMTMLIIFVVVNSLPRVSQQGYCFIAGIVLGALLSYLHGILSQKNAEIRRLESKLQRQRNKASRNSTSNDQANSGRTSDCDPHKKCWDVMSNILAIVTDLKVNSTVPHATYDKCRSGDAHQKCSHQMNQMSGDIAYIKDKLSNGSSLCNCRCNAAFCPSAVTTVPPRKLVVVPPITIADIAPKSANIEHGKASVPVPKAVATTIASEQLSVMLPVTTANFAPALSNTVRGMDSIVSAPSIVVLEPHVEGFSTESVLSVVHDSSSSINGYSPGSIIETLNAVPVPDEATLATESIGSLVVSARLSPSSLNEQPPAIESSSPPTTKSSLTIVKAPTSSSRSESSKLAAPSDTKVPVAFSPTMGSTNENPVVPAPRRSGSSLKLRNKTFAAGSPLFAAIQSKDMATASAPTPSLENTATSAQSMDSPALEQAHRPATVSPSMVSPNPPQAAPPETPKVTSGSSIMTELANDNVGSINSNGRAKPVRAPSPETAPAPPGQQKLFVPDPKAMPFSPINRSAEATKVETPSLLSPNLSLHSPGKVIQADLVKDTGMSGNETLSIPSERIASTPSSSKLKIPDFLEVDVPSDDAGAAARRQYGGLTSGQAQQRTAAIQETPSAGVTTEQPDVHVEIPSLPSAKPIPAFSSSKLRVPAFIKTETSDNDAGAAARRQYGAAAKGQVQQSMIANEQAPSAGVTTEQPHPHVEVPSLPSANPISALSSSKLQIPAFIKDVTSDNDAGAAARRQYGGAAKGQVQPPVTANKVAPSIDTTSGLPKLHRSTEPEFSPAGGLESSKWSEAPERSMTSKSNDVASKATTTASSESEGNVKVQDAEAIMTPSAEKSIPVPTLPIDQDPLDDVVAKMNDFSLGGAKKRSSSKGIKVPKKPREDNLFKTLKAHAAGDISMSSPMSTPAKASPEKENSSGCELGQSMWANASASPMPIKAPYQAPRKDSANEGKKQKPKFEAPAKPPMPAWMKGTDYELRWLGVSEAPIAMKWMPPPEAPAPPSPVESPETAPPVQRKTFFVPTAQPEASKPKLPAFLANGMGPSDPGAAARKQYGGFAPKTEAQPVKPSGTSSNGAAAPPPRSPSPQLPGLGASQWAAPAQASPVPRSASPQLPGLGASRWAAPAPAPTGDDKPFVQPTLPGRKNNGGGKRNNRKGW